MAPNAEDEAAFMQQLLAGMDVLVPEEKPIPSPSPPSPRPPATPSKRQRRTPSKSPRKKSQSDAEHDFASLCDGAEDWDDLSIDEGQPEPVEDEVCD